MVEVVEGRGHHVAGVLAVWTAVAAEGLWIGTELPIRPDWSERFLASFDDPSSRWFVAEDDSGSVVGAVSMHAVRGLGELGMAIVDGHRGAGVGRALVDRAVRWASAEGCHKVVLEVWPHNERAIRLYASVGFESEGVRRRHYRRKNGELWDAVAMGLVLDSTSPGSPHAPAS